MRNTSQMIEGHASSDEQIVGDHDGGYVFKRGGYNIKKNQPIKMSRHLEGPFSSTSHGIWYSEMSIIGA